MLNKFCIFVFNIALISSVKSQAQLITLYETSTCSGPSTQISANYVPDLSNIGFDNTARSARLVGTWLFYDRKNYNSDGNAPMEYAYEANSNICVPFQSIGGLISSTKFAGVATDIKGESITFYENTYFQGAEEYITGDFPYLRLNGLIKSLIVTGRPTTAFTLYDRPNYSGNSICIFPPSSNDYTPALIYDTTTITVPHGTIASVKKGCQGLKIAKYTPTPRGYHI